MGKITHIYEQGSVYPSGVEISLDSGQEITIGNSSYGIKVYDKILFFFPRLIWRCDNPSFIEKSFPILKTNFIGSPLETIAQEIISRFKTKKQLISFLQNLKV